MIFEIQKKKEYLFLMCCCSWKNKLFHRFLLFYLEFKLIEVIQRFLFGFSVYEQYANLMTLCDADHK